MGKPKEKKAVKLPAVSEVPAAQRLVEKIDRAKARLAKVAASEKAPAARKRVAKKRVKRAQRRLRSTLAYAGSRKKAAPAGGEAPPAS
jgi:GTP1/Obg family GTP-binding protein